MHIEQRSHSNGSPPITGHSEAVRFPAVGISPLNGNRETMAAHALLVKRETFGCGSVRSAFHPGDSEPVTSAAAQNDTVSVSLTPLNFNLNI